MEQVNVKNKSGILKNILNVTVDVVIVLVLIVSVFVIIANASSKDKGISSLFGYTFASVESDSMTGTFEKGDIAIGKLVDQNTEIKVGDIISFWDMMDGVKFVNTHRVVEVFDYDGVKFYDTQGDKPGLGVDPYTKSADEVIAIYKGKIGGVGHFIDFMRKPIGFILVIVLPFLIIIVWETYRLIAMYMEHKKQQIMEEGSADKEISEADRQKIIDEFLKKQQQEAENAAGTPAENDDNGGN